MADKFREIEAYLKAKIHQADGMIQIISKQGIEQQHSVAWWVGNRHAYEDMHRILFGNQPINLNIDKDENINRG